MAVGAIVFKQGTSSVRVNCLRFSSSQHCYTRRLLETQATNPPQATRGLALSLSSNGACSMWKCLCMPYESPAGGAAVGTRKRRASQPSSVLASATTTSRSVSRCQRQLQIFTVAAI